MMMRLTAAVALALLVSGCGTFGGGGDTRLAYVTDPVEVVPTARGSVQVTASSNPPGYWVFPDGTYWPMGYAPRRVNPPTP